jgi:hypothetical protein
MLLVVGVFVWKKIGECCLFPKQFTVKSISQEQECFSVQTAWKLTLYLSNVRGHNIVGLNCLKTDFH